ncbi:cell division protein FtsX [Actinorhabdospora filicis]|uniref:Cell division protein FtsX n=1 Tax=Actinorhabdospora filicis TaxID=1785913 RepID=A0A9W6SI33_9ACTN|nr:permease-like cell division protein FtsX [Actinorhabdospora filicis]GLZ76232.1 cell division protein FtsX [Actinorhabdospora filicis]
MRAKYVLSEVLVGLWRNVTMTIAMIVTMAVSLAMLGASLLLYMQVSDMEDYYYTRLEVSIFFTKEATQPQMDALGAELRADPLVAEAKFETKDEAYKRFQEMFKEAPDLVNAAKSDSLPASYRVKPADPNNSQAIIDKYGKGRQGIVANAVDQRKVLSKIFEIFGGMQKLALVLAIVQGLAALLLVANTIQVAAFSKRREVAIMKLVGASNWFVQAPFVLEAVFAGVIGAILAYLTLIGAKVFIIDGTFKSLFQSTVLAPIPWSNVHLMFPILAGIAGTVSAITGWVTLRFQIKV